MTDVRQELTQLGFTPAGVVTPDAANLLRVHVHQPLDGCALYAMVVGDEIKKFGTTGRKNASFKQRMHSTFSALRRVIQVGPPYTGDPFKRYAPLAILDRREIELWSRPSTPDVFEEEETSLNRRFRPEWTKEGAQARRAA